jgi:hypothetical protein
MLKPSNATEVAVALRPNTPYFKIAIGALKQARGMVGEPEVGYLTPLAQSRQQFTPQGVHLFLGSSDS